MQENEERNHLSESLPSFGVAAAFAMAAVAVSIGAGFPLFGHADDADVTAQIEAAAARKRCPIEIAQFGPGERWRQHHIVYACATAARETPAHLMSYPVAQ